MAAFMCSHIVNVYIHVCMCEEGGNICFWDVFIIVKYHNKVQLTTAEPTCPLLLLQAFCLHQRTQQNHCFLTLLLKITPLQLNNEARFFCGWYLTCMMGIVGGEGFQLLSVSVTDRQGDRTMGRQPLTLSNCLVVKPTAGALNDKRGVSFVLRKGDYRNGFKEREGEWQRRQWGLHKEIEGASQFSKNGTK